MPDHYFYPMFLNNRHIYQMTAKHAVSLRRRTVTHSRQIHRGGNLHKALRCRLAGQSLAPSLVRAVIQHLTGWHRLITLCLFCLPLLSSPTATAQSTAARQELSQLETSLKRYADSMIHAQEAADRFRADSHFVRGLVRALKVNHSFSYPFESLETVSRLYAPDSSFRIFSWQMKKDEYFYLQKGAIQMKTRDGSLKLYPLFDYSMHTSLPLDSVRTPQNWIGAIYYKMVLKEHRGKKYYTLLGFDGFSIGSNKKWMEVLTFNQQQEPVFGGPFISFQEDSVRKPIQYRFGLEYKKEAAALLTYDADLDMILFDHLISETDEPEKKNTYIPDGTYEGFTWKNGLWVHVDKVFHFQLEDGQFPVEHKLYDDAGNVNEDALEKASQKNLERSRKKKN